MKSELSKYYPYKGSGRYCPKCGKFTQRVVMKNPRTSLLWVMQEGETYHCPLCDIVFRVSIASGDTMRHSKSYIYKDGKEIELQEENCIDGEVKG